MNKIEKAILEILSCVPDGWGIKNQNVKARLHSRYKIDLEAYAVNGLLKRLRKQGQVERFVVAGRKSARWRLRHVTTNIKKEKNGGLM